ncbi:LysR substrate-binding domain-containing protein [Paenibacillus xanthanilyticus]|uniref:LysR substrate-binding domain-containing protein n=1 Tax=Paenibacillus xanthanilyticus TaxID=1783531 RepID=UPI00364251F2
MPRSVVAACFAWPILVFTAGCSLSRLLLSLGQIKGDFANPVTMEFRHADAIQAASPRGLGISLMPLAVIRKHIEEGTLSRLSVADCTAA